MKLINNSGTDRVIDLMRPHLAPDHQLACVTPSFSLFAFAELREALAKLEGVQLILPPADDGLEFLGGEGDRAARMRLDQGPWNFNKLWRKAAKHAVWLLVSFATGGAFVLYWHDARGLSETFFIGQAPMTAYVFAGILSLTTYALAGTMRQVFPQVFVIDTAGFGNQILVGVNRPVGDGALNFQRNFKRMQVPVLRTVMDWALRLGAAPVHEFLPTDARYAAFTDDKAPVEQLIDSLIFAQIK